MQSISMGTPSSASAHQVQNMGPKSIPIPGLSPSQPQFPQQPVGMDLSGPGSTGPGNSNNNSMANPSNSQYQPHGPVPPISVPGPGLRSLPPPPPNFQT